LAQQRIVSQSEFLRLQRQVNDLSGELDQTRLAIPRVETAISEAEERIANARSNFRSDAFREMSMLRSELAGITEVIVAGEDRVRRTEVRSPSGAPSRSSSSTRSAASSSRATPSSRSPRSTTRSWSRPRPPGRHRLSPSGPAGHGQDHGLRLLDLGGLEGRVEQISADTITDERGESFYRVRVRTNETSLGTAEAPLEIIPA
jgi:adhesin transport system membrane fusion protein